MSNPYLQNKIRLILSVLVLCGFVSLIFLGSIAFYLWDASENRGYTIGYWQDLNVICEILEEIPGVEVVSRGGNPDIFLEEMFITINTDTHREVRLPFEEDDPVRDLPRSEMRKQLELRIETEQTIQDLYSRG